MKILMITLFRIHLLIITNGVNYIAYFNQEHVDNYTTCATLGNAKNA